MLEGQQQTIDGIIKRCYNKGKINGLASAGGIAFSVSYGGTIEESYNIGNILVENTNSRSGGIAGAVLGDGVDELGIIRNCYNLGKINGVKDSGGIVGILGNQYIIIENCYNIGVIIDRDLEINDCGGIIGKNENVGLVRNCYYLEGVASGAIHGVDDLINNVESKTLNYMSSIDIINTLNEGNNKWKFLEEHEYIYPILDWQNDIILPIKLLKDEYNNYNINTKEDLILLAEQVNNGDSLKDSIIYLNGNIKLECNLEKQWEPIGENKFYPFEGIFEGSNYSIEGIYIQRVQGTYSQNKQDYKGLFGINKGEIKNLNVSGTIIGIGNCYGGIAGSNEGIIKNCIVQNATILSKSYAGGIAGSNEGEIIESINMSNINIFSEGTYSNCVGGITGINKGLIDKCINRAEITSSYNHAGGIAGSNNNQGIIRNSLNKGEIFSTYNYAGGITGWNDGGIENCYNTGVVEVGNFGSGGIAGYIQGSIYNSYNIGEIKGVYPGGTVGGTNRTIYNQ